MTDRYQALRREVRVLRAYVMLSTLGIAALALSAVRRAGAPTRFGEIDVQRINVVEPDGTLRMVIADKARSPGPIEHGKPFGYKGGTRPGLIFYNDEGTEDGGLVFGGAKEKNGPSAGAQLSFDQYDQDQVVYMNYQEDAGRRSMGLHVADRADFPLPALAAALDSINAMPDGPARTAARQKLFGLHDGRPMFAPRVFVGRDTARAATVVLSDPLGRPRLRMFVDSTGAPHLEFLDARGRVVQQFPTAGASPGHAG